MLRYLLNKLFNIEYYRLLFNITLNFFLAYNYKHMLMLKKLSETNWDIIFIIIANANANGTPSNASWGTELIKHCLLFSKLH